MNSGQQPTNIQNGVQSNIPLLSKEKLGLLYQKLEQMKKQGLEKDPNYEKYRNLLRLQVTLHQQHKQQQQMQPQFPTEQPILLQQPIVNPPLNQQIGVQFQQLQPQIFTKNQLDQLKAQIYCLRFHLLKNTPIPNCLLQAIKGINIESSLHEYELLYRANTFKIPTPTGQIPPVTTKLPNGLDLHALVTEREKRVKVRMKRKFDHLKTQLNSGKLTEQEKTQKYIEIKAIQLVNTQKILRQKVFNEFKEIENAKNNLRKSQRKLGQDPKKPFDTQPRRKPFKRVELDPEFNQRDKFKKINTDISTHRKKYLKFHQDNQKNMEKVIKELKTYFEKKAKIEKEKKEKAERARLKALKENDSEAYYKLLVSAKETRLLELLKQTDNCLKSLGAQLVNERMKEEGQDKVEENNGKEEKGVVERFLENEKAYYTVAHRFSEKIDKQPTKLQGGDLKEYQISGLQWLVSLYNNKLNGILADEMGLGKTVQTIALLTYLMEFKSNHGPHLIIVPLSTIENWRLEFQKWAPHIHLLKYGGSPKERKSIQTIDFKEKKFNVLLVQYEYITRDKKHLKKIPWNYIIIDEGHRIKNKDCILVRDLKQYKSEHRLLLTGTPLQNDLKELWALLNFLLPKIFDNSTNFETWFNTPFQGMGVEKEAMQMTEEETLLIIHRLHQVLRPFLLRREKKDVEFQLPEKVEKIIRCSLSGMQKVLYEQIQNKNSVVKMKQKTLNNSVMQLRKVCNHPYLFFDDWSGFQKDDIIRSSGKFELLNRILPKMKIAGHKVLIFSQMTHLLDILGYYLESQGHKFLRLDGNVKAEIRGKLVKDFNSKESDYFVFLLSTRAGGLGLNLQAADTVIIFDSDWNPQQDLQAMARAHRIGQTKAVRVFVLVTASPVEEKIYERAQEKRNAEAKVIKAGMFDQKSTHHQRQDMLETILLKNDDSYDTEIPNDTQLNQILSRGNEEFILFEKMDKEIDEKEENYCKENNIPRKSRLITEEELPSWLKEKANTEADEEELVYGRGLRNKKIVSYEIEPKKEEIVEMKQISNKKRKDPPKEKRKKKKKKEELNELEKDLENIWNILTNLKDMKENRDISFLFMDLPSKEYYPDYYQIINNPICFNQIYEKIYKGEYETLLDFEKDIQLLCTNAQTYNLETSFVYQDSLIIMSEFKKEKEKMLKPKKEEKIILDDEEEEEFKDDDDEIDLDSEQKEEEEDVKEEGSSDFDEKSNSGNEKSNEFLSGDDNSNSGFDSNLYNSNSFDNNGDSGFLMW